MKKLLLASLFTALFSAPAFAGVLVSTKTGNFTDAGTWARISTSSYLAAESVTESLLTTAYSATRSSTMTFTAGHNVVTAIGVKIAERLAVVGTMSVHLILAATDVEVAGTEATIDVADLPGTILETEANGGWVFFKLAAPVTLSVGTAYKLEAKTSSASQVDLWCDGTVDNISRAIVTNVPQAPVAGDDLIISGVYTGPGAHTPFTVTMDNTTSTDFGSGEVALSTPALAVCALGTLTYGTNASTAYNFKLSGNAIVYASGTFNMGTVATPMPATSTGTFVFDPAANVDIGLLVRNGGTFVGQGAPKTSWTYLTTDEAAAATVIGVADTTGWLTDDVLVFAPTGRTATQVSRSTISTVDSGVQVTLKGTGNVYAHSGTSPTQAEVGNITRNVKILGKSDTLQAYIDIKATAIVDLDYVEIANMGSAVALKGGIQALTTASGSCSIQYCALRDFMVAGSDGFAASNASSGIVFSNNVTYNMNTFHVQLGATSGAHTIDNNLMILNAGASADIISLLDVGSTVTNNHVAGAVRYGILVNEANPLGTFSGNVTHSNANVGINFNAATSGVASDITTWRNNASGLWMAGGANNITFNNLTAFGNSTNNILLGNTFNITFATATLSGDSTFSTANGLTPSAGGISENIYFDNSTFGVVSGIKTAHTQDVLMVTAGADIHLNNTTLASATEVGSMSAAYNNSSITSQRHDGTAGLHKSFYKYGIATIDTTAGLFDVTPSVRITPSDASNKVGPVLFRAAVANGQTANVSVKVRESVVGDGTDYNGNRIRLLVKRNSAAGINTDTVLITATVSSEGAFETISGTTIVVTDDAILEFFVDCDGTTGWINVDTWVGPPAASTLGMNFWEDGIGYGYGNNSTGGGGGQSSYAY